MSDRKKWLEKWRNRPLPSHPTKWPAPKWAPAPVACDVCGSPTYRSNRRCAACDYSWIKTVETTNPELVQPKDEVKPLAQELYKLLDELFGWAAHLSACGVELGGECDCGWGELYQRWLALRKKAKKTALMESDEELKEKMMEMLTEAFQGRFDR